MFDSVYSVAISEVAVYVGGHFNYMESPTAPDPWPGLDNVGYGRGQGLAGYGLGDDIVDPRPHRRARPRRRARRWSGTPAPTPSRATRPCSSCHAASSPAATPPPRAARTSAASPFYDFNSIPAIGTERDRRSSTRSRVGSRRPTCRSWSTAPPPRPAASSGSQIEVRDRDTQSLPPGQPDHLGTRRTRSTRTSPRPARRRPPGRCR